MQDMRGSVQNKHHSYTIDYIRAISALLIVLYHYTYRYNENLYIIDSDSTVDWPFVVNWGYGAVATFFMLSGFLLAKYFNKVESSWKSLGGKLLINRLLRLYPTYWVSMSLTTVVLIWLFPAAKVTFSEFIVNLTMMASTFQVRFIDGAYWTLGYEVKFAILLSLILTIKKVNYRKVILLIWLILSIVSSYWSENNNILCKFIRVFLITDWIQTFIAGICIYQIKSSKKHDYFYWFVWILCLINQILWISSLASLVFFLTTSLLLYHVSYLDSIIKKNLLTKSFEFIASISYPLYLIHQMIGFAIIKLLINNGFTNELWLLLPISVIIIFSFIIHRYIELPTSRHTFRFYPKILK